MNEINTQINEELSLDEALNRLSEAVAAYQKCVANSRSMQLAIEGIVELAIEAGREVNPK